MKRILMAMVAVMALTLGMVAPAAAQAQEVSADPGNVAEAGEHELTVTGSGYTGPAFLLPCPGANGDPAGMGEDSCDATNLTPVNPDGDGNFTAMVTFDIPAEGLVFVVGNAAQDEVAVGLVTVGAAEVTTTAALADTGVESSLLLIIGGAVVLAGLLFAKTRRDLSFG